MGDGAVGVSGTRTWHCSICGAEFERAAGDPPLCDDPACEREMYEAERDDLLRRQEEERRDLGMGW